MPTSTRTNAPRRRTRQRQSPHLSFRVSDRRHWRGNPRPHRQVEMHGTVRRERIAAPVCGLVRNDMIDSVSIHPNPLFAKVPACGSMWASTPTTECAPLPQNTAILHPVRSPCGGVRSPRPTHYRDPFALRVAYAYRALCIGRTESSAPTMETRPHSPTAAKKEAPCGVLLFCLFTATTSRAGRCRRWGRRWGDRR